MIRKILVRNMAILFVYFLLYLVYRQMGFPPLILRNSFLMVVAMLVVVNMLIIKKIKLRNSSKEVLGRRAVKVIVVVVGLLMLLPIIFTRISTRREAFVAERKYVNEKMQVTLMFPDGWCAEIEDEEQTGMLVSLMLCDAGKMVDNQLDGTGAYPEISLNAYRVDDGGTFDELLSKLLRAEFGVYSVLPTVVSTESITVDGLGSYLVLLKFRNLNGDSLQARLAMTVRGKALFCLWLVDRVETFEKNHLVFDNVLRSLNF